MKEFKEFIKENEIVYHPDGPFWKIAEKAFEAGYKLGKTNSKSEELEELKLLTEPEEFELWWDCKYCGENEEPHCNCCVREDGKLVSDELA